MKTPDRAPALRWLSIAPHTFFAVGAVGAVAFGLSHPYVLSLAGLDAARQRAIAKGLDREPTGAISYARVSHTPPKPRGLVGLRAAMRETR